MSLGTGIHRRPKNAMHGARRASAQFAFPALAAAAMAFALCGCSSKPVAQSNPPSAPNPQGSSKLYFAPTMGDVYASTYSIDHTAKTFVRTIDLSDNSPANGTTVTDSGVVSMLPNGVLSLGITYNLSSSGSGTTYNPPMTGSWAIEIPGEAALIGMNDYTNFTPVAPTNTCPSFATPQTIQFVTIPNRLSTNTANGIVPNNWNPQLETAFGSVQISTNGTQVQFGNVKQYMLPADGKTSAPSNPGPGSASALCASTFYGQTIGVPVTVEVIDPGTQETVPPSATIGVGPSGFLVEDAGSSQVQGKPYENILGAGYGAVGLPQPSSAIDLAALASAQYKGFLYGSGGPASASQSGTGFSLIGSFGFKSLASSCPALPAPKSDTTLYGGEFASNDPASHSEGNCDLAIRLGEQNGSGLFESASVYVSAKFPPNTSAKSYSFPAVAIAGQIQGKFAILLIGVDTQGSPNQAWGIYLLQTS